MMEEKENYSNIENYNTKLNDLPEPEISENEMKEIIEFINNWDYEKYERDSEVREALLLLRSKMKQEEKEKDKKFEELLKKEKNDKKNNINKDDDDLYKEEDIKDDNKYSDEIENKNKVNIELSEQEKEILEKNWNSSTKPEYDEKILNEKGDKEIIINNDKKMNKVSVIYI